MVVSQEEASPLPRKRQPVRAEDGMAMKQKLGFMGISSLKLPV